jgi:phosphopantetheine--protein transferase-like protein
MIGNDIVDLEEAKENFNWQRPRFLEKLFTPHEQQLIQNSENAFLMVWRLWSMKEAAYKLYTQIHPSRFYKPKQFECKIDNLKGTVSYQDFECYLTTQITTQYIVSEARLMDTDFISEVLEIESYSVTNQSAILRAQLVSKLADRMQLLKHDLNIIKSEFGIPSIYHKSEKLDLGISFTHHGHYGAYGFSN